MGTSNATISFHAIITLAEQKDSLKFLMQANDKCQRMWNFYFKHFVFGIMFRITLLSIGSILFSWYKCGHLDSAHYFYLFKIVYVNWFLWNICAFRLNDSVESSNRSDENRCDKQFLCDLIRFHTSATQWVNFGILAIYNLKINFTNWMFSTDGFWIRPTFTVQLFWLS